MRRASLIAMFLPLPLTIALIPRMPGLADALRIVAITPASGEVAAAPEMTRPAALTSENSIEVSIGYILETTDEASINATLSASGASLTVQGDRNERVTRGRGSYTTRLGVSCPSDTPEVIGGLELHLRMRAGGATLVTESRPLPHTVRCRPATRAPTEPAVTITGLDPPAPAPRGADAIRGAQLGLPISGDALADALREGGTACPDLGATSVGPYRPPDFSGLVFGRCAHQPFAVGCTARIRGFVRNEGTYAYRSSPPAEAVLYQDGRVLHRVPLEYLPTFAGTGEEFRIESGDVVIEDAAYRLAVEYPPGLGSDSERQNDDCNAGNNSKEWRPFVLRLPSP